MQHRLLVLLVVDALRSLVLDAKRRAGFTVLLLPLAEGETDRVAVEARDDRRPPRVIEHGLRVTEHHGERRERAQSVELRHLRAGVLHDA